MPVKRRTNNILKISSRKDTLACYPFKAVGSCKTCLHKYKLHNSRHLNGPHYSEISLERYATSASCPGGPYLSHTRWIINSTSLISYTEFLSRLHHVCVNISDVKVSVPLFYMPVIDGSPSQWPSGLRRGSTAARLLRLRVWIPLGAWISVSCKCGVLSGTDLCEGPIPRPEQSYRLWCVIVCDLQRSSMRRPWPALGCCARKKKVIDMNPTEIT